MKLYGEFSNLAQTRKETKNANYNKRIEEVNASAEALFDIFCKNEQIRKRLEELHGGKMTSDEWEFLNDQSSWRKMFCENFVNRKWLKTMNRRKSDILSLEKLKNEAMEEKSAMDEMVTLATSSESEESYNNIGLRCNFEFKPTESSFQTSNAQKRRKIVNTRITEQTKCQQGINT